MRLCSVPFPAYFAWSLKDKFGNGSLAVDNFLANLGDRVHYESIKSCMVKGKSFRISAHFPEYEC